MNERTGDSTESFSRTDTHSRIKKLGVVLVIVGFLAPVVGAILPTDPRVPAGSAMAYGFWLVIIGLVFVFPDLLKEKEGSGTDAKSSSMRVVVLVVVSAFALLVVKAGWEAGKLPEIHWRWAALIGLTLGAKSVQKWKEKQ